MANKINVVLELDTTAFQRSIGRVEKQLQQFGSRLENIGTTLSQRLTLPLLAAGAASVKAFADFEKLSKGLAAVMGSSEAAEAELVKLREVAKLPGLGFKEAVQGSVNLQAVGLSADQARQTLRGFGAAIAATGGGAMELQEVQRQLTQIISKNRILQEDYGVLQERVPLIGKALEAAFGTSNIENVRAMGVSGQEFVQRISEALIVLPQTQNLTGGLANALENLRDSLQNSASQFGQAINKAIDLEGIISKVATAVQRAADFFSSLNPAVQKTIVVVGLAVAAIGPLLFAIGSMAKVSAIAVLGFGKLVAAAKAVAASFTLANAAMLAPIVAIGLLIAGIVSAYREFEGFRKVVNGIGYALKEFAQIAKEAGQAVVAGFAELKEGNFKAAAKKFGEAIVKTNPVGIALTEGKRLQDAFKQGFEDNTDYVGKTLDKFKKTIAAAKNDLGGSVFDTPTAPASTPTGGTGGGRIVPIGETAQLPTLPLPTQLDATAEAALRLAARYETLAVTSEALKTQQTGLFESMRQNAMIAAEEVQRMLEGLNLAMTNTGQVFVNWGQIMGNAIAGGLSTFSQSIEGGIKSLKQFGQAVRNAAQQAVSALIKEGVTAVISKTLVKLGGALGPLAIPLAAAAGSLAAGVFNSAINSIAPPRLAKGGLVTSEQLVTVGDNPSGKEAIIPFERMGQFLDMAGGGKEVKLTGLFEVRGSDLVLVLDRAKQEQLRIR